MASIIGDYEYDIFISYRQKDNKGDHWVTEFVNALRIELDSLLKNDVSIYFDVDPHIGLLETHDVDRTLEGKLRCLIFIPIISRTYCDPKSFAWVHEFCAFHSFSKKDQFGTHVKLHNGNVAGRILPVKIHELDEEDRSMLESELGGPLRAVEFIYKEPGVSRPLKHADDKHDNLNKTDYANQINKVANAVRDILVAIQHPTSTSVNIAPAQLVRPARNRYTFAFMILVVASVTGYYLSNKFFFNPQTKNSKAIAVLPFVNMSADPEQEYLSDGLTEELINVLARNADLRVIARTSAFAFKNKNEDLTHIGNLLGVKYILEGSVRKSEKRIRIACQLFKTDDGVRLWSRSFDREMMDILDVQTEIATEVANYLDASIKNGGRIIGEEYHDATVYNLLLQGRYLAGLKSEASFLEAEHKFKEVLDRNPMNRGHWPVWLISMPHRLILTFMLAKDIHRHWRLRRKQ